MVDELAYRPPVIADTYPPFQTPNIVGNLSYGGAFGVSDKLSFFEFLAARGLLIMTQKSVRSSGPTTATLYTVPDKKVFYLTACTISCALMDTGGFGDTILVWYPTIGNIVYLRTNFLGAVNLNTGKVQSMSFPIPLRFDAGQYLVIAVNGTNVISECSIFGYEIDA